MNFDDHAYLKSIDSANMLAHLEGLADQIEAAWALGQQLPLPDLGGVTQIVLCGSGSSALGGALVAALTANECLASLTVNRDPELPAWAAGPQTLIIGASHSGHTQSTLEAFKHALDRRTKLMAITSSGPLAHLCQSAGGRVWAFAHAGPPRAALGYSFALPLALICRSGLVADKSAELNGAVTAMREQQKRLSAASPVRHNPAKRLAGQLMDRYGLIVGAGPLAVVAQRWKAQIAENAKAWAQSESLLELAQMSVSDAPQPEALISKCMALFLESDFDPPHLQSLSAAARERLMTAGFNTDVVRGVGNSPLAQMLTCLHYGDYVSYYLALAYGVDPTPVESITG